MSKDDVEGGHRQDADGLPFHPGPRRGALVGRTMAVAAGLADGMEMAAVGATIKRAAQRRRPALLDTPHDLQRDGVEAMTLTVCGPGVAEDIRHAGRLAHARSTSVSHLFLSRDASRTLEHSAAEPTPCCMTRMA